jgi:RNA polymerase sigma-70 factor, ECF subfamily
MLGSFHDAEDATQETLLRAWRFLSTFQGQGSLRAWLYRIATTTCLKAIQARRPHGADGSDVPYLEPYPDRLLDDLPADGPAPAAVAEQRTSVALAFVAALQRLTARQRAVLLLRDVLDWKASEVAGLMETSVPAANSALQRARASLGRAVPPAAVSTRSLSRQDRVVLDRFMEAWQRRDIDGLVGLLREDAVLQMPPLALRYVGREQIARFLGTVPAEGRLDRIRLVATQANGQPAVAAYLPSDGGPPGTGPLGAMTWRGHLRADPLGWLLATDTPAVRAATLQRLGDRPADAGTSRGRRPAAMKTLALCRTRSGPIPP